jgi:D-sedoheptulose 7-phosphate isomerase
VYIVERAVVDAIPGSRTVSLEREVFPPLAGKGLYGFEASGVFVDIGTPQSLAKADNLLHEEFSRLQVESRDATHGRAYLERSLEVQRAAFDGCVEQVARVAEAVVESLRKGGKILLCGNGGSAADCQHIATELVCRLSKDVDRPALPAVSLTTDTSVLTAYGNDSGFEGVFARQVEAHGRPGDVLIGISTSGRSINVIRAVEAARAKGLITVALTGSDGSLRGDADYAVTVPDGNTQHIQEALLPLEHLLCELIERAMFATGAGDSRP